MGELMGSRDDEGIQNAARLAALRRTSLLDSPPEEAFDRLTRLATTILHVPAAYVSLVDGDRQFFKSSVGLPEPWASLRQTPLTHSFCKHVVASGEPLLVSDARQHPLVRDNLAVSELGVIAYAGIPLTTTEGLTLGSFCVVDAQPREWTEDEIEVLRGLAASVMTEIGTRRLAEDLKTLSTDLQRLVEARTSQLSRAEERWRVLLQVNNAVVTCLDRGTLLQAIADALRGVIPYDRMALVLDDPIDGGLKVLAVAGPVPSPPVIPVLTVWPRQGSRSGWIAETGLPVLTPGSERRLTIRRARPADPGGASLRAFGAPESQGQGHRHAERRKPGGCAVRGAGLPSCCSRSRTRSCSPSRTCSRTKRSRRSRAVSSRRTSTCKRSPGPRRPSRTSSASRRPSGRSSRASGWSRGPTPPCS